MTLETRLETPGEPAPSTVAPPTAAVADSSATAGTSISCAKGDSNPHGVTH